MTPALRATASLTWWRNGLIRKKILRQRAKKNRTITSWQNSSRNPVGFVCTNAGSSSKMVPFSKKLVHHGVQVSTAWCSTTPSWSRPTPTLFLWRLKPTGSLTMPWKPLKYPGDSAGCPVTEALPQLPGTHTPSLSVQHSGLLIRIQTFDCFVSENGSDKRRILSWLHLRFEMRPHRANAR